MIVAMMLPPKAGRVCSRCLPLSGSMARPVQSAVSPVSMSLASLGIRSLPVVVAAARTMAGLISESILLTIRVQGSVR